MSNTVFDINNFVNRDAEIDFMDKHCLPSLQENRPINPQFIEYNGVWGIGKTSMLRRIEHHCFTENFYPLWIEASDSPNQSFHKIAEQVRNRYKVTFSFVGDDLDGSLAATRALLNSHGRAVLFIDSLDAAKEEQLKHIKEMLHRLTEDGKLLFIMASRKIIDFGKVAPFKWKLVFRTLKSLSRQSCISYIQKLAQELNEEQADQIFQLTRGYPVAVEAAVQAVKQEKLDLTQEKGRKQLIQGIYKQIIEQGILAEVHQDPDQFLWYHTMLSLFAIPRRFNLILMQKMTEKFAEQHKLGSSLAYMSLQKRLNYNMDLLDWREDKTGYAMEAPIRHLFLMNLKFENPQRHAQIHEFLMEENWRFVMQFSGTDKLHSLQEYLYHSIFCHDEPGLQENIDHAIKQLLLESHDLLLQFEEEYTRDDELQDALGVYKYRILSAIYSRFAETYWILVPTALNQEERIDSLYSYILYRIKDPILDLPQRLSYARQSIERVKAQESAGVVQKLIERLSQHEEIQKLLGNDPQAWNLA
ncbi:hypothetical protein KDW_63120 [Dictyobacter vulcani]|uniref:Uncharacterized protein n=1 Tax=Dictyobacter vulcani TaxID=2607529 RepID=A0A5J4L016_9CHLR|nr:ATP-binding protein [Dictyobacter vulcani]GER92150.1 hypothetical protein KDW_63120 [Dictyobacter vulcani]